MVEPFASVRIPAQSPAARVGLIVPSCNNVVEWDFQRVLGTACSLHAARMWSGDACTPAAHAQMNFEAVQSARYLGSAGVDLVAYCCTTGSSGDGAEASHRQEAELSAAAGDVPCISAAGAVLEALARLGASRVGVLTPYSEDDNARLRRFLMQSGFVVTAMAGRGYLSNSQINADTPESILEFALSIELGSPDAVFLSCTNWRAVDIAAELATLIRLPVVTSNSALIGAVEKRLRIPHTGGMGRLMAGATV